METHLDGFYEGDKIAGKGEDFKGEFADSLNLLFKLEPMPDHRAEIEATFLRIKYLKEYIERPEPKERFVHSREVEAKNLIETNKRLLGHVLGKEIDLDDYLLYLLPTGSKEADFYIDNLRNLNERVNKYQLDRRRSNNTRAQEELDDWQEKIRKNKLLIHVSELMHKTGNGNPGLN